MRQWASAHRLMTNRLYNHYSLLSNRLFKHRWRVGGFWILSQASVAHSQAAYRAVAACAWMSTRGTVCGELRELSYNDSDVCRVSVVAQPDAHSPGQALTQKQLCKRQEWLTSDYTAHWTPNVTGLYPSPAIERIPSSPCNVAENIIHTCINK